MSEGNRSALFILTIPSEQRSCPLIFSETCFQSYKGYIMRRVMVKGGKLYNADISRLQTRIFHLDNCHMIVKCKL